MNRLKGTIVRIESDRHLSLVEVQIGDDLFSSVVLETPESFQHLSVGKEVYLLFKETEVSIAKNLRGEISLRNRFPSIIKKIIRGRILSQLILDYKGNTISSIITTRSCQRLRLNIGDEVIALVKANEMSIVNGDI